MKVVPPISIRLATCILMVLAAPAFAFAAELAERRARGLAPLRPGQGAGPFDVRQREIVQVAHHAGRDSAVADQADPRRRRHRATGPANGTAMGPIAAMSTSTMAGP